MSNTKDPFVSINSQELEQVAGGAQRVASGASSSSVNDQLMLMLTQIGDSIKDLARNNNGGTDQFTQMMMMMMMMGGFGGGGGGGAVAAPPVQAQPSYIDVGVSGGGCRGRKGW